MLRREGHNIWRAILNRGEATETDADARLNHLRARGTAAESRPEGLKAERGCQGEPPAEAAGALPGGLGFGRCSFLLVWPGRRGPRVRGRINAARVAGSHDPRSVCRRRRCSRAGTPG